MTEKKQKILHVKIIFAGFPVDCEIVTKLQNHLSLYKNMISVVSWELLAAALLKSERAETGVVLITTPLLLNEGEKQDSGYLFYGFQKFVEKVDGRLLILWDGKGVEFPYNDLAGYLERNHANPWISTAWKDKVSSDGWASVAQAILERYYSILLK